MTKILAAARTVSHVDLALIAHSSKVKPSCSPHYTEHWGVLCHKINKLIKKKLRDRVITKNEVSCLGATPCHLT